jgi:FkbM family methyltransferase
MVNLSVGGTSRSSRIAQRVFDFHEGLNSRRFSSTSVFGRALAKVAYHLSGPAWNTFRRGKWVRAHVYGRELIMPAEHPLVPTVAAFPLFNRPLALAAAVLSKPGKLLSVVDVGANIGETVAVIEQMSPRKCVYLCIEPEPVLAELCRHNYSQNERVFVKQAFVGESRGVSVALEDDGRANPSTKFSRTPTGHGLDSLDAVARDFVDQNGVDLIKTDTEGFDFTILRSAVSLLRKYGPALYFEWYPELLLKIGESPESIFHFLEQFGYRHWVFFTSRGEIHCELSEPTTRVLEVLAGVAQSRRDINYFDVFTSRDQTAGRTLTDSYLRG